MSFVTKTLGLLSLFAVLSTYAPTAQACEHHADAADADTAAVQNVAAHTHAAAVADDHHEGKPCAGCVEGCECASGGECTCGENCGCECGCAAGGECSGGEGGNGEGGCVEGCGCAAGGECACACGCAQSGQCTCGEGCHCGSCGEGGCKPKANEA